MYFLNVLCCVSMMSPSFLLSLPSLSLIFLFFLHLPLPFSIPSWDSPLSFHRSFLKHILNLLITYIHHRHKSSVLIRSCLTLPAVREINDIATSFSHKKGNFSSCKNYLSLADPFVFSFIINKYIRRKWDIVLKFNLLNKCCYSQGLTYSTPGTISPKAHELLSLLR